MKRKKGPEPVSLPTEKTERSNNLEDYSILVHGEKKIGKTTLFAQEDTAFFLMWDPLNPALELFQESISGWAQFLQYIRALELAAKAGTLKYRTIVVDGADIAYEKCFAWKCDSLGIDHPNDENDFGKSWKAIKLEFADAMMRLMKLPDVAIRIICHSQWREVKQRDGEKVEKLVPLLSGQAEEVLVGVVDVWAAYCYSGSNRVLVIIGDESTGAGHRIDHGFRTHDGRAVQEINMGKSPKEAYANFVAAFNNELEFATLRESRKARAPKKTQVKAKAKAKAKTKVKAKRTTG